MIDTAGGQGRVARRRGGGRAVILACLVLVAGCHKATQPGGAPHAADQAAAVVNGQTVWVSDVRREAVSQGLVSAGEPFDPSSELFHNVLDEVVDQKLLAAEAMKRRLDRDPVVQRRLAAAREQVLGDTLVQAEVSKAVNDKAVQALYAEQLKHARQGQELHARQIVVPTQADAMAVRKLLDTGASFQMLAMDRSTDANTRFNGGDLGYFTLDVMPAAYGQVLGAAKVGEVVGPFQVEGGYALVKVEDRRVQAPMSLAEARPQIVRFLTYDQVRDLLERLRASAKVKVMVARRPGAPTPPVRAPAAAAPPAAVAAPQAKAEPRTRSQALPGALPLSDAPAPAASPAQAKGPHR